MKSLGALGHLVEQIRARFGLDYGGSRLDVLLEGLARVDLDTDAAAQELLRADRERLAAFVGTLTNTETYFFRHAEQFSALQILLQRQWMHAPPASYRAWCAGCSTGEEPITVSAVLEDLSVLAPVRPLMNVVATDINPDALRRAQEARYSEWSFRGVLKEQRERYFVREDGGHFRPRSSLRARIGYRRHNLLDEPPEPVPFDLVVCRNVLIYFDGERFEQAVNRLALAVAPGGILVLGPVESAAAKLPEFDVLHPGACVIYRKRHAHLEGYVPQGWTSAAAHGARTAPVSARTVSSPRRTPSPPLRSFTPSALPVARKPPAPIRPSTAIPDVVATRFAHACALADQGRLAEARAEADALAREHGRRGELHILSALILLEEERRDEAAAELEALVAEEPGLAMAHYLLGSIFDTGGDRDLAETAWRRALEALDGRPPLEAVAGGGGLTVADLVATLTHVLGLPSEERR